MSKINRLNKLSYLPSIGTDCGVGESTLHSFAQNPLEASQLSHHTFRWAGGLGNEGGNNSEGPRRMHYGRGWGQDKTVSLSGQTVSLSGHKSYIFGRIFDN